MTPYQPVPLWRPSYKRPYSGAVFGREEEIARRREVLGDIGTTPVRPMFRGSGPVGPRFDLSSRGPSPNAGEREHKSPDPSPIDRFLEGDYANFRRVGPDGQPRFEGTFEDFQSEENARRRREDQERGALSRSRSRSRARIAQPEGLRRSLSFSVSRERQPFDPASFELSMPRAEPRVEPPARVPRRAPPQSLTRSVSAERRVPAPAPAPAIGPTPVEVDIAVTGEGHGVVPPLAVIREGSPIDNIEGDDGIRRPRRC